MEKTCIMCGRRSDDKYGDFCCYCGTPFPKVENKSVGIGGNHGNQEVTPQAGNYMNQGYPPQPGTYMNQSYTPQQGTYMNQGYQFRPGNYGNQGYTHQVRGYVGQGYNPSMQDQYMNQYQPEMSMKWYKWCLYAVIPLNILVSLVDIFSTMGSKNWKEAYTYFPELKTPNIMYVMSCVIFIALLVVTFIQMKGFKRKAWKWLVGVMIFGSLSTLIYAISAEYIIKNSGAAALANEFTNIFGIGNSFMEEYREKVSEEFSLIEARAILSMIAFSIINIQYFRKRDHLFVN